MRQHSLIIVTILSLAMPACSPAQKPSHDEPQRAKPNLVKYDLVRHPPQMQRSARSAQVSGIPPQGLQTPNKTTQPKPEALTRKPSDEALLKSLIAQINQTRQAHGRAPLTQDRKLMAAAQDYAAVLSIMGDIKHIGPRGEKPGDRAREAGYQWSFIGENLASGQDNPATTINDWLKSPGHRDTLLHADPKHLGVGFSHNAADPLYKSYWVLLVGHPLS